MHWYDLLGYLGSVLMFSTFYMKTMIPLRLVGIAANVSMIVYTAAAGIYPVLILQACLLPLNVLRLVQMRRLIDRVAEASTKDFKLDALVPRWIAADWPLERPRYVGRDLTWDAWLDLPDLPTETS